MSIHQVSSTPFPQNHSLFFQVPFQHSILGDRVGKVSTGKAKKRIELARPFEASIWRQAKVCFAFHAFADNYAFLHV
jgi:hypothetical protein